jgi:UDP-N-acetylglucosamine diphosphorylase / glucose-1-phosphate thymidylyltransferase / UDP-N-acetylgalactosamine diphosphorylase / glucosamine-1-phosphate N-acetyltransferase / galactosamine-1-phosphate N-acetyltransferase
LFDIAFGGYAIWHFFSPCFRRRQAPNNSCVVDGDSLLGSDVSLEAGSIICNYRNERTAKEIQVRIGSELQGIGVEKFGALVGDHSRIGANAVIAPGAILLAGTVIRRTQLCDQDITGS